MHKYGKQLIALVFALSSLSCKKDILYFQKAQQLNSGTNERLNRIKFLDRNICIVAGGYQFDHSVVLRSADGGYKWAYTTYPSNRGLYGMDISAAGVVYMCGDNGNFFYSKNSGNSFKTEQVNNLLFNVGIAFPVPDTGYIVSSILQKQGSITRIDTNGNIIDNQTFLFGYTNVYMTSAATGYVIGYGTVMKTIDHGATWNFQSPEGDNFTGMDIHGDEIWMCGSNGSIYHTMNGGANWQRQRNGNDFTQIHYGLRCIVFKDENNGWAAGDDGKIIHSDDGGNHWSGYDQFTTNTLRCITLCPNGDLLVAGDNGSLFRLTTK